MCRWSYLHEKEIVSFHADPPRPRSLLWKCFSEQGFTKHKDIVYLARPPGAPVWQSRSTVEVSVNLGGVEKFGFGTSRWDELQLQYLFAHLPFEEHERFIAAVERTSDLLQLLPHYRGAVATAQRLREEFAKAREEVLQTTGEEPGSEVLAILILDTYPRST